SVAGLGQNPSQTVINGSIDVYNQCSGTTCNATDNFWRSVSNLTINVTGGTVTNGSQQQYFVQNSSLDGWSNSVWNQVFCGDPGAPAQSFGVTPGTQFTTLGTCPVTEEEPFLYTGPNGSDSVFVPAVQ